MWKNSTDRARSAPAPLGLGLRWLLVVLWLAPACATKPTPHPVNGDPTMAVDGPSSVDGDYASEGGEAGDAEQPWSADEGAADGPDAWGGYEDAGKSCFDVSESVDGDAGSWDDVGPLDEDARGDEDDVRTGPADDAWFEDDLWWHPEDEHEPHESAGG